MNQNVIESIEQVAREKHYSRIMNRLTDALVVSFGIPEGQELIAVLGHGHESNNREAVRSWVALALQNPDLPMAVAAMPHLVRRLENTFSDWESQRWA